MDIERSLTYVFEDDAWLSKVAIGGILVFIPVFGWLVLAGYWLRLVRQVYLGVELPLPHWNDFGGDFVRGLKVAVVWLVWMLPFYAVMVTLWCVFFLAVGASDEESTVSPLVTGVLWVLTAGIYGLLFAFQLVLMFVQPLFLSRLAISDSVGAAFNVAGIVGEARRNPIPLLLVLGLNFALGFLASLGFFLCFIGIIFTTVITYLMLAHLYGQLRRSIDGYAEATSAA